MNTENFMGAVKKDNTVIKSKGADSKVWSGDPSWTALSIQACVDPGKQPTPEQVAVIEGPLRPTLVVAGAGSGKTETMSMRVLWLVAHTGISPERILGLTFTRKAAGELGERLRSRLASLSHHIDALVGCGDPTVTTYNSFAQRVVKEHGWRLGFSPESRVLGGAAAVQLMSDIVREQPIESLPHASLGTIVADCRGLAQTLAEHGYTAATVRDALKDFAAEVENQGIVPKKGTLYKDARSVLEALGKREAYLRIIEEFEARKKQMGVIDFADQLSLATRLVKEYPDVVHAIRSEFDAVLLDEFQDTSVIQMELFSTLFGSHQGGPLAVTAVGDPHQAIYGWRGASAASLENFIEFFDRSGDYETQPLTEEQQREKSRAQTLTLSTAWRNDRQILAAANVLAAPLQAHTRRVSVQPLRARTQAGAGAVHLHYAMTPEAQADYIASEFARILDEWQEQCQATPAGQKPPKRPSMAVLSKRRKDFARYDEALRARGIPTQVFDTGGLLQHPTVARLRNALIASSDVEDPQAVIELVNQLRLGAADMALLWQWAQRQAVIRDNTCPQAPILLEAVDTPPAPGWKNDPEGPAFTLEAHQRVSVLGQRLRAIRNASVHGLLDHVERAFHILGLVEDCLADHTRADGRAALDAFIDVVATYTEDNEWAELNGFLAWLDIAQEEERGLPGPQTQPAEGAVHIMTVHASKGLEWDVVAVIGMGDGAFPQHRSTSRLRELIHKGDHFETNPDDIWPGKAWMSKASELPYDLRGDRSVLPLYDYTPFEGSDGPDGNTWTYAKWVKNYYAPEVGRYLEREQRRLAYVAVTRARQTLYLTGDWLDGTTRGRQPSMYFTEILHSLLLQGQDPTCVEHSESGQSIAAADTWMAHSSRDEVQEFVEEWERVRQHIAAPEECIEAARENLEEDASKEFFYPIPSDPAQQRIEQAANEVLAHAAALPENGDVAQMLDALGSHEMLRHAVAIVSEYRRRGHEQRFEMELSSVRATAVASLVEDKDAFALNMRRPLPARPSSSASLGTLIHSWVERQLRQVTPELWAQPVEGVELLSEEEQERFRVMQENFLQWSPPGRVSALEESFSVRIAGVNIQGRIDAVFTDDDGDIIVDWKSGRLPHKWDRAKLYYFRDQLRLYQQAWATRAGCPLEKVRARLYFLEHNRDISLDLIEQWIADGDQTSDTHDGRASVHETWSLAEALAQTLSDDDR